MSRKAPVTVDRQSFQRWRLDGSPMTVNQLTLVVAVESKTIRSATAVYN